MAIFQPNGAFSGLLTTLLTIYVAAMGYRLLLGRSQLRVSDFALNAVKLGAVVALATQWDTYQTVVYNLLFQGPQQLASVITKTVHPGSELFNGDIFDSLQIAFDDLLGFGSGYASHAPAAVSPALGGSGFAAVLMTSSATLLLLSSLGVLLVAKIVLGLLLAVGPIFIALFLFDSTRGIFEGWLRATLAFTFAPLATTVLLSIALVMLEPSLHQIEELQKQHIYSLEPAYSVLTLILVFAGVAAGTLIAGAMIAVGFRLPKVSSPSASQADAAPAQRRDGLQLSQSRAGRVAAAAASLNRRDATVAFNSGVSQDRDRRVTVPTAAQRGGRETGDIVRLGQDTQTRRINGLRATRANARIAP
jgi:type IV secretion system protein VirB6